MKSAKLSQKYQVVIPRKVRQQMGLTSGSRIYIQPLDEHRAVLVKEPMSYTDALEGLGADLWQELGGADAYIARERDSWDRDRS